MKTIQLKAPLVVELTLTEACNHKCIHCYNTWREKTKGFQTLSYKQIDIICKELKQNEVQFVIITGGEPTLDFNLLKYVIASLKELGIGFALNSNITALNQTQIHELRNYGVHHILTSLPSLDEKMFEHITNTPHSYSKFISNIELLNETGIDITVNMVISQKNIHEIKDTKSFIKKHGIKGLTMSLVIPPNYDKENEVYKLDNNIIIAIADTLLDINKEIGIYVNSLTPLPLCILKDVNKYQKVISATCSAGISVCTINADGTVQACAHDEINYGNIFSDGLKTCWDKMIDRRLGKGLNKECFECKYIGICGGECRMLTDVTHKVSYTLDKEADIKFNKNSIPLINPDTTYTVNNDAILRMEDFGASININYENYFISNNIVRLFEIMKKLYRFKVSDLYDYVEINDNFNSVLFYMESINMIKKIP